MDKIGTVVHYFDKINVAVIQLEADLTVGDKIKIKSGDEEFEQTIGSMQVDHQDIEKAKKGTEVAIKIDQPVKEKDEILKAE